MRGCLLLLLLFGASCGQPGGDDGGRDDASYADAIRRGADGLDACRQVGDPSLRGDCLGWVARKQSEAGQLDRALQTCDDLPHDDPMRGECIFQVADARAARGAEARALCARAEPFTLRCLEHAVRRELRGVVGDMALGAEGDAEARAEQVAAAWVGASRGRRFARHAVARHLSQRPDDPFAHATCGTVSDVVCSRAYELRIDAFIQRGMSERGGSAKELLRDMCPAPVSLARVTAAGGPLWAADVDAQVSDAWRRACAKAAATARGPIGGGEAPGPGAKSK